MKSYRKELWFNISSRRGFINITSQVEEALRESEIKEGLCLVNASLLHLYCFNSPKEIEQIRKARKNKLNLINKHVFSQIPSK